MIRVFIQNLLRFSNVLARVSAIKALVHPYTCRRRVSSDCLALVRLPEPGEQAPDLRSDD